MLQISDFPALEFNLVDCVRHHIRAEQNRTRAHTCDLLKIAALGLSSIRIPDIFATDDREDLVCELIYIHWLSNKTGKTH